MQFAKPIENNIASQINYSKELLKNLFERPNYTDFNMTFKMFSDIYIATSNYLIIP